ncbi:MAG: AEC family transporter [Deltaproteobacteria bacterium]|nr:AEC family transporter [Deltaproteobacteria bacterium]
MSIILNSLFPVFALMVLGAALRRFNMVSGGFLRTSDTLIYFIFFPIMLFWKIGAPAMGRAIDWRLCLAVISAIATVYAFSLAYLKTVRMPRRAVGSFSQASYRFNSYVGVAIVLNTLGDTGVRDLGVMIGFAIPFINLLAVSTLIWHSDEPRAMANRTGYFVKSVFSNPLILACLAGIGYARLNLPFPTFVDNTFRMFSLLALPLALISIGGSLDFSKIGRHLNYTAAATVIKLVVLPVVGYGFLKAFGVTDLSFKVGMIYFALPTSAAIYVLSSQLGSDVDLGAAAVLFSTLFSFLSLSAVIILFV